MCCFGAEVSQGLCQLRVDARVCQGLGVVPTVFPEPTQQFAELTAALLWSNM